MMAGVRLLRKALVGAAGLLGAMAVLGSPADAEVMSRPVPHPLPSHPGNIFLAGEQVSVPVPSTGAETWRATDYEGKRVAEGQVEMGRAELGKLPVGYYQLAWGGGTGSNHVTLGLL